LLNFPIPYRDELLYSVVARYGVHFGITSPKQLLDDVFNNRKVIATIDLPNHLSIIAEHYTDCYHCDVEYLAYKHTLFPLYAPFVPEKRRLECLRLMAATSQGAIHLSLGVAASRIKQTSSLRYCPQCLLLQHKQYGEYFWKRIWQITGADCCLLHGELKEAAVERHAYHRHQYFAPCPDNCPDSKQNKSSEESKIVTYQVEKLLNRPSVKSADLGQWTTFYHHLAEQNDCCKGKFINYAKIVERVLLHWPKKWLVEHGLSISESENCWLKGIFRKHRKSFSYLEHIVVLQSFLSPAWNINDVLDGVYKQKIESEHHVVALPDDVSIKLIQEYQQSWMLLVKQFGVKAARYQNHGGAIYAWLYRHNKVWLLNFNSQYRIYPRSINNRVDWQNKDYSIVRELLTMLNYYELLLDNPKMTRNWYIKQLKSPASVEKNLSKLPLCNQFFMRYCENTTEYQIRRLTKIIVQLQKPPIDLKRWKVLRLSGLSEERLKRGTRDFLTKIMEI
jgi:hypothetical protein